MIFYYIRHAQPIYDPDSLTELGHMQAEALSKRLTLYGLDEIYSSTSIRAQQTAEPTCKILKKKPVLFDWAHENFAGRYLFLPDGEGKRQWLFANSLYIDKLREPEVVAMGKKWYDHPYFSDITSIKDGIITIENEADKFFASLGFRHERDKNYYVRDGKTPPERVAFFAHEGFGAAFLSAVLDIPYNVFSTSFAIAHSTVTAIHFNEKRDRIYPKVLFLSNDSHLYKEDLMNGYNTNIKFKV